MSRGRCVVCRKRLDLGDPVVALAPGDLSAGIAHLMCWCATTPPRRAHEEPTPDLDADLRDVHVLIVDGHADCADMLAAGLELGGATTTTCASGREVFEVMRRIRPDVIVVDLCLDDPGAFTILRRVRAMPAGRGGMAPMVAVSCDGRRRDAARAAGFVECFQSSEVFELVRYIAGLADAGGWRVITSRAAL